MRPMGHSVLQLLLSTGLIILVLIMAPPVFSGDIETARNYLNTVAQTLATIFAISISIITVAIQMTASRYSHRVLDLYIRFPYNISLFVFYLFTIIHSVTMLSKLQQQPDGSISFALDKAISADLFLFMISILSLVIYMYAVMRFLKPEMIIAAIEKEYRHHYQHNRWEDALDRMEQIADIGKRSIADLDAITGIVAVEKITDLLHAYSVDDQQQGLYFHQKAIDQLLGIASISFKLRETFVSTTILDEFHEMGQRYVDMGLPRMAALLIEKMTILIKTNLLGQQQTQMIEQAVVSMYQITGSVAGKYQNPKEMERFLMDTFRHLNEVTKYVMKTETYGYTFVARFVLSDTFGDLLATIIRHDGPVFSKPLITQLIHEYSKIVKRFAQESEIHDMVIVATWMREEMLSQRDDGKTVLSFLYLFVLINAISLYLGRRDLVILIIRAIGKYFYPFSPVFEELLEQRIEIRYLFDYQDPEPFIQEIQLVWQSYYEVVNAGEHAKESIAHEQLQGWSELLEHGGL